MIPPSQELLGLLARSYGPEVALGMVQRLRQRQQYEHHPHMIKSEPLEEDRRLPVVLTKRPVNLSVREELLERRSHNDEHEERNAAGRRMRNNNPAFLACHVCGDRAPNHIHYGGIACFSCRAFFRRSVPKFNNYFCMAEGDCKISASTRKNCQYCRYQACLRAGMKSSWVLSDKEKLERTAKKMANRAKRIRAAMQQQQKPTNYDFAHHQYHVNHHHPYHLEEDHRVMPSRSSSTGSTTSSTGSASPPLSSAGSSASGQQQQPTAAAATAAYAMLMLQQGRANETTNSEELDDAQLERWVLAQESTRQSVPMPGEIMSEVIRMTVSGREMGAENTVELFKTGYSRVAAFARTVDEFAELDADTRKSLLSKNLDVMTNLRLCSCLNSDGSGNLLQQLRRAGRATDHVEYAGLGSKPVELEQVFAQPWAKSQAHQAFFCATIRRVARYCHDERTGLLAQLVALFHSFDVAIDRSEQRAKVEAAQLRMVAMLKAHLQKKLGRVEGVVAVSNLIVSLQDLRRLADILTGEEDQQGKH